MSIIHVKEGKFEEEVLQSRLPVLVDYWAEWCGPCRMFSPIIEEIARQYHGKLKVCKVDIEENPTLAVMQRITNIPTACIYVGGKEVKRLVGLRDKPELDAILREYIEK